MSMHYRVKHRYAKLFHYVVIICMRLLIFFIINLTESAT